MRNPSAEEEATRDGATLNAFTVSAVAKNVSTLRTADYFAASADLAAFAAQGPRDVAAAHITYGQRQRESLASPIMEYLAAARNILPVLAATPFGHDVGCRKEAGCAYAPCTTQTVIDRLRALTERQKSVLELVAQGLPNKLIAYELGLSETTIKAHVSGILRKLCVYSRARAIVLLANIDLASIGEAELREEPDRPRHIA
jgi:DNA-binding CsgD family transcriptional regulator